MAQFSFRWGVDLFDNQRTPIPNWILANYHRIEWLGMNDEDEPISGVGISNTEMMFIIHLASFKYESEQGQACPSLTGTLARRMNYRSNQGIINVEGGLVSKGLLLVEKRPGKTSVYDFKPFSEAIIKVIQESSTKLDDLPSTNIDDPEVPSSTEVDESRQEKLTRRKEEEKEKTTEEEEPKKKTDDPLFLPETDDQLDLMFPKNANGIEQQLTDLKAANWQPGEMVEIGLAHYLKATRQVTPSKKSERKDWEADVSEHIADYGASVLAWLYPATVKKMRANNWNISRPGSMNKTMRSVYGEHQSKDWLTPTPAAEVQARLDAEPAEVDPLAAEWDGELLPLVINQFGTLRGSQLLERDNGSLKVLVKNPQAGAMDHLDRGREVIKRALGVQEIEFVEVAA